MEATDPHHLIVSGPGPSGLPHRTRLPLEQEHYVNDGDGVQMLFSDAPLGICGYDH